MTDPKVTVTIGALGQGEREIELGPGESFQAGFNEPAYIRVDVPEIEGDEFIIEAGDTEYVQDDGGSDREWDVKAVSCSRDSCGTKYPKDYTRCPDCGHPNPKI